MDRMYDSPVISPEHKNAARDIIARLPKVDLHHHLEGADGFDPAELQTPDALTAAVTRAVVAMAEDNVVYVELRLSPELYTAGGLTLREVVDCAVTGIEAAREQAPTVDARLILTAMRGTGLLADVAELTVATHGDVVVGFDVAGPEEDQDPLAGHAEAFASLRDNYVPVTVHAGLHGGIDAVADAVRVGATRLSHATHMVDDFSVDIEGIAPGRASAWIRDRHITVESAPLLEVELGAADDLGDHPLPRFQQLGFTCAVATGNAAAGTMTDQFLALSDAFGYGLEEFFEVTVAAVNNAFISQEERQRLLETVILPAYEELADPEAGLVEDPDEADES